MNDRFRLKLWDKINGIWVKEFRINQDGLVLGMYNAEQAMKKRFVLVQCTGLKDKNGKLIYEGDMVRAFYTTPQGKHIEKFCEVEFRRCAFWVRDRIGAFYLDNENCIYEVIGNIYENKELLNETNTNNTL